jgi:hypothetical protein
MKAFEGFKSERSGGSYPMLPVGAYVCEIKNVKIEGVDPDQQMVLRLEIVEGDYTNYYTNRYNFDVQRNASQPHYGTKYKGDFRLNIPNPANTKREHPEWDVSAFNNMVFCVESSNEGYKWNWDEKTLKGKKVGINGRAGTYNGNPYTTIGKLEPVDDVRKGLCKAMRPKADSNPPAVAAAPADPSGFTPIDTEDLPF